MRFVVEIPCIHVRLVLKASNDSDDWHLRLTEDLVEKVPISDSPIGDSWGMHTEHKETDPKFELLDKGVCLDNVESVWNTAVWVESGRLVETKELLVDTNNVTSRSTIEGTETPSLFRCSGLRQIELVQAMALSESMLMTELFPTLGSPKMMTLG